MAVDLHTPLQFKITVLGRNSNHVLYGHYIFATPGTAKRLQTQQQVCVLTRDDVASGGSPAGKRDYANI